MSTLPPADEWNRSVEHSKRNPAHILGPYDGDAGEIHMDCNDCGFDSAKPWTEHVCAFDEDGDCIVCGADLFASAGLRKQG